MLKIKNWNNDELTVDIAKTKMYSVKFEKLEDGKKIFLMNDNMFKTMFVNSNNVKYGAKLISYFVDSSYEELLNSIEIKNVETDKSNIHIKGGRCDYVAQIGSSIVNIEVNCNASMESLYKSLVYGFKWLTKDITIGSKYKFSQTITINLNNFSLKDKDDIVQISGLRDEEGYSIMNKLVVINIFVPNLRKKWYTCGIENLCEMERYILSLIETDIKVACEIGAGDEFMEKSIEEQVNLCMTEDLREAYDHDLAWKEECRRQGLEEGREQGLSEGRTEGIKEGRLKGQAEEREKIINKLTQANITKNELEKIINIINA